MDKQFWQGKKVLITGHTGFKGSWLSFWLQAMGATVIGFSLPPPSQPNLFTAARIEENTRSYLGDIRDFDSMHSLINKEKPEIVFHLAAQALVRFSYDDPIETYSTNVMGTVNLLEALRRVNCARVAIVVTSDKCYENREWQWGYRENEPMGGYDPYSSSKGCAELVTAAFRQSYCSADSPEQLFIASARAGNVIGGGDWATDRLIPDFLRAMMSGTTLKIRYPHAIRPWQHVLEPLSGYLLLAENLWFNGNDFVGAWNFGSEEKDAKSVEWIANHLTVLWGEGASWVLDENHEKTHEARYLKLDISKARAQLKWRPMWALEKALQETVLWYKKYMQQADIREVMHQQILSFQAA